MIPHERYPELEYLGSYFNEDWMGDSPTWHGIIDIYFQQDSTETVQSALHEISDALSTLDEAGLEHLILRELDYSYLPLTQTYREWLIEVRDRIQANLGTAG